MPEKKIIDGLYFISEAKEGGFPVICPHCGKPNLCCLDGDYSEVERHITRLVDCVNGECRGEFYVDYNVKGNGIHYKIAEYEKK